MNWFVNIDQIPVGKHLFTVAVTTSPRGTPRDELCYDEIDVIAPIGSSIYNIIGNMSRIDLETYNHQRVVGIADQSDGYIVYSDPDSHIMVCQ